MYTRRDSNPGLLHAKQALIAVSIKNVVDMSGNKQ